MQTAMVYIPSVTSRWIHEAMETRSSLREYLEAGERKQDTSTGTDMGGHSAVWDSSGARVTHTILKWMPWSVVHPGLWYGLVGLHWDSAGVVTYNTGLDYHSYRWSPPIVEESGFLVYILRMSFAVFNERYILL